MKLCIFDDYHTEDKNCTKNYDCRGCDTHETIAALIKAVILNEKIDNQSLNGTEAR